MPCLTRHRDWQSVRTKRSELQGIWGWAIVVVFPGDGTRRGKYGGPGTWTRKGHGASWDALTGTCSEGKVSNLQLVTDAE